MFLKAQEVMTIENEEVMLNEFVNTLMKNNHDKEITQEYLDEYVKLNLIVIAPLWGIDPEQYMNDLIDSDFDFILTTVSSYGENFLMFCWKHFSMKANPLALPPSEPSPIFRNSQSVLNSFLLNVATTPLCS